MKIQQLLSRRTDLSTFLVHLTRDSGTLTAKDKLKAILSEGRILASSPFGSAVSPLQKSSLSTESQNVVCFTETPLEHVSLLTHELEDRRSCQFLPYGVAITKMQGRRLGANPVWYVDITPGHDWLSTYINQLIEDAVAGGTFDTSPISKIAPFVEQMGSGTNQYTGTQYKKEFWWEREWRHLGSVSLPAAILVLCPQDDIEELNAHLANSVSDRRPFIARFIDPAWSLEKIIGHLAGFSPKDLGPI
jgi:hypothetical protein